MQVYVPVVEDVMFMIKKERFDIISRCIGIITILYYDTYIIITRILYNILEIMKTYMVG